MRTTASLLFVLVAACGGASEPATTPPDNDVPPAAGPTCADASANAVAELGGLEGLSADQMAKLEALFTQSCTDDAWSPEAIRCVAESKADQLEGCESLIPKETHERVGAQIEAILGEGHRVDEEPPPPTP